MAESVQFRGYNRRFEVPSEDPEEPISITPPMFGKTNGCVTFTCWELSDAEIKEIIESGVIWMAARTGERPLQPHWVGSYTDIKKKLVDTMGGIWRVLPYGSDNKPLD